MKLLLSALLLTASLLPSAFGNTTLHHLRCEYLTDPLGIDVRHPRLSWKLESGDLKPERGVRQSAYQILAASSEELLQKDVGDLWDSGKVVSDETAQIVYGGKPLQTGEQVFWKVRAWDQNDQTTPWSEPAKWSMGLLKDSDWKAEWIGLDDVGKVTPTREAELADKGHKITITKALYGVKGDPAKQIDIKEKLQAHVDAGHLTVEVTNEFAGRDPIYGEPKVLEAEWLVEDWKQRAEAKENSVLDLTTGRTKTYLPAPYFRKEFDVFGKVKRAIVYATAQGVFELTLNGRRVGDEVFMPGWTDYRKRIYYRAYDVTDLLKEGPNVLGAILGDGWFRGNISNIGQNQYGNKLRLKAQLQIDYDNGNSETIATDSSWRATTGPILESDMQAGEVYDARRDMPGWDKPGFDASAWSQVVTGSNLNPPLQAYPGVPVRPMQELPAVKVTEPKPGTYVFDLGQNFSGWARLKVNGQAGDKITLIFAEMLKEDGTAYTINLRSARAVDTYILKGGGEEVWEPRFTFHGFRFVQVSGLKEKPSADAIRQIHPELPADYTANEQTMEEYLARKSLPQVEELMKNYKIDLVWFDTPAWMKPEQGERFLEIVRKHNPDCVTNSRLLYWPKEEWKPDQLKFFDYVSLEDKEVPPHKLSLTTESPDSVSTSYGYKAHGEVRYHTLQEILHRLVHTVCGGGNYLLNFGPMGNGRIDPKALELFQGVGAWIKDNGESLYGTQANPLPARPAWGDANLSKDRKTLYLHVMKWPADGKLRVDDVPVKATSAAFLSPKGAGQSFSISQDGTALELTLPPKPIDENNSVIKVALAAPFPSAN